MLSPGYLLRVVRGMSLDKYKEVLDRTAKFSGMSKSAIAADMLKCAVKFGAGYYDYVTFGFWDLTDEQRDTFLTRLRNKKLISHFNDDTYEHLFDNKEDFNNLFRDYIKRDFINFQTSSKGMSWRCSVNMLFFSALLKRVLIALFVVTGFDCSSTTTIPSEITSKIS